MTGSYLVTGSAGFIGAQVVQSLLAGGNSVTGVDNLCDAYDVGLKRWRLAQLETSKGWTFHQADVCGEDQIKNLFNTPFDAVIHLAARAGVRPSVENPGQFLKDNLSSTLNLLELCREYGTCKFLLASSSSLYGSCQSPPYNEEASTDRPLSPYAASKKAAELMCYSYHHLHKIDVSVLRYFTVYGPAGRPDMSLFRFVQWISEGRKVVLYGDGSQSRDFTYVGDIVCGTIAALKPLGYEIINLGSDEPVMLMDAINLVEELVGKKAYLEHQPRHIADVMTSHADITKASKLLGWRPQTSFREGVSQLVSWYFENREWAKDVRTSTD